MLTSGKDAASASSRERLNGETLPGGECLRSSRREAVTVPSGSGRVTGNVRAEVGSGCVTPRVVGCLGGWPPVLGPIRRRRRRAELRSGRTRARFGGESCWRGCRPSRTGIRRGLCPSVRRRGRASRRRTRQVRDTRMRRRRRVAELVSTGSSGVPYGSERRRLSRLARGVGELLRAWSGRLRGRRFNTGSSPFEDRQLPWQASRADDGGPSEVCSGHEREARPPAMISSIVLTTASTPFRRPSSERPAAWPLSTTLSSRTSGWFLGRGSVSKQSSAAPLIARV